MISTANYTGEEINEEEENNNNVNKVTKESREKAATTTVAAEIMATQTSNDDEVIEEFDFSDSDLRSLSADEADENQGNTNLALESIQDTRNLSSIATAKSADVKNEVVEADNNRNDKIDVGSDIGSDIDIDSDNNTTKVHTAIASDVGGSAGDIINAIDNNKAGSGVAQSKSALQLNLQIVDDGVVAADASLPFCPITPRRIVDMNDTDDEEITASNGKAQAKLNNNKVAADADDDGSSSSEASVNDKASEVVPEDELLVQFLGEANRIAEARLAARRQARAEAREIRMRELERQQKEQEQNADRVFDMHNATASSGSSDALTRSSRLTASGVPVVSGLLNATRLVGGTNSMSSRRSSEDSLEEEGRSLRDIRLELKDVEERFRKAMIANAQLDNDRASQMFEVKLLKDKIEAMQEAYAQLNREFKDKTRDFNALKRNLDRLTLELKLVQGQLNERDTLIAEQGLVIVAIENADGSDAKRALVSVENANVLASVQGSLDVRLKKFNEEKQQLIAEVQKLQDQLETYKSEGRGRSNASNGPLGSDDDYEAQREANKIISDYKYKLQKAEQEIASLQASLARTETQVIRYKSTAEATEKAEAELKIERRKLQRENREAMERLEELETSNNHLLKRLDKLKNAKSALFKEL